jgi:drug/metabolite transporter (DMT)-like permease
VKKINKTTAYTLIIFASLCFGSYGVWARIIGDHIDLFYQVWARSLITIILLFPILYFKKLCIKPLPSERKDFWAFIVSSILIPAPILYAYNHMSLGGATLLFFLAMTVAMICSGVFFFKEKITRFTAASFALGISGLLLLFLGDIVYVSKLAPFMALLAGAASGLEISLSQKLKRFDSWYLVLLSWTGAGVVYFILSMIIGENIVMPAFGQGFGALLIYAVSGIIGFAAIMHGARGVSSSTAGFLSLLEVIFGVFLGYLLFDEIFSYLWVLGGVLIVASAALTYFKVEE